MEEMAGAPKQAMGIRTPGEKTAFEVQSLENAAGRIFQEKTTQFEIELLEKLLNNMLEVAKRHFNGADVVRIMDDDLGVTEFMKITKEDITAKGKLRPVGARHFAARAQLLQNLSGVANSQIWPGISKHISNKALAKLVEDSLQLQRFELFSDNAQVFEEVETQRFVQQAQEDLAVEAQTPIEGEDENPMA
jgi:4-hydroxy-3-methylbut-2-en-1-yl diphosphate synthase IspG/GcpE